MGRPKKPAELLVFEKKSHKTKAEIEERLEAEDALSIGDSKLNCPSYVRNNQDAYRKWKEVVKLYKDFSFVTSGDRGHLARLCMVHSEYLDLIRRRDKIAEMDTPDMDEEELAIDELEERRGKRWAIKTWNKINYIMSTAGLLQMDKAINAKCDLLCKMEDRAFLNPVSRIKAVPQKEKETDEDPLSKTGF